MLSTDRSLTVYATEPALLTDLPKRRCVKYVRKMSEESLLKSQHVFVLTSLLDLERTTELVRQVNQRHHLRALFVFSDDGSELLPQLLSSAKLRAIRNMFVHHGTAVPKRVLNAFCIGAEHDLIANARLVGDELVVVDCASDVLRVKVSQVRSLRRSARDQLGNFTIADDGSYLHWPTTDVHLGLEDLRILVDSGLRERLEAEKALQTERIGAAIRILRRSHELVQGSIPGLSERQVRRIENGAGTSVSALRKLARAHGQSLSEYVNELARIANELSPTVSRAVFRRSKRSPAAGSTTLMNRGRIMAKKTVKFTKSGATELPTDKPVVYRIKTKGGRTNYVGVAKRGRVQERIREHLDGGAIPGAKVQIEQVSSIADARKKEQNIISRLKPKYNEQGK